MMQDQKMMNMFNSYINELVCALMLSDGYKTGHHMMYPRETAAVYSNLTPRSKKHAPEKCNFLMVFGNQMGVRKLHSMFQKGFFDLPKRYVCDYIKEEFSMYLGCDYDVSHFEELHDLGYLPIIIKGLPEGTRVPIKTPIMTIRNTDERFFWITNYLETILSQLLWKPMTSATIAYLFKKKLIAAAAKTDKDNIAFVDFQAHDFSMRGLDSIYATMSSGLGHAICFLGSDSLPVIPAARMYYDAVGPVIHSVNATEHSVMCAGGDENELDTFRYLMDRFPNGILSIVSDTWDLWKVITEFLPQLKEEIMKRDGKIVIRPDSGNPVDIICGIENPPYIEDRNIIPTIKLNGEPLSKETVADQAFIEAGSLNRSLSPFFIHEGEVYYFSEIDFIDHPTEENSMIIDYENFIYRKAKATEVAPTKGVIELLWDIFGGTTNEQGYKVLDPHIGAIYGDAISLDRADQIIKRLEAKGFASTNVVLGIGSFTYQFNTRDSFGFAVKATHVYMIKNHCTEETGCLEAKGTGVEDICSDGCMYARKVGVNIFKNPKTDDGRKKSAKGLLYVGINDVGEIYWEDEVCEDRESQGLLTVIYKDGNVYNSVTLNEIRQLVNDNIKKDLA